MTELRDLWEQYGVLEKKGQPREKMLSIERRIHEIQKERGSSRYDFDKRWGKKDEMMEGSMQGPPKFDAPTTDEPEKMEIIDAIEKAKKLIGENDIALLEECLEKAEAFSTYGTDYLDKINPANTRNAAMRGQKVNLAMEIFKTLKDK